MGIIITGADTYPANVDLMADGEKANATVLGRASRDLANRTAWLKARKLEHDTAIASLQGDTSDNADAIAAEVTRAESAESTLTTALSNETSRAENAEAALAERLCILDVRDTKLVTTFNFTSAAYVDVTGLSLAIPNCAPGDILVIDASLLISCLDFMAIKIMIDDAGSTVDPGQVVRHAITEWSTGNVLGFTSVSRSFKYVVTGAGTVTISAKAKAASLAANVAGTAATDGAGSTLRAMRIGL